MTDAIQSEFIFALCNPGSETALKLEVACGGLAWRSGYQRRGFVTFKADSEFSLESLDVQLACARRLCLSLGKFATREDAAQFIYQKFPSGTLIHHARYFERKMQGIHHDAPQASVHYGNLIGTVVELSPNEFWAGIHRHGRFLSPDPAGDPGIVMSADSPSRAWLKLEEALRFFDLKITSADIVVELGCAPGGVVLALLQRGVSVIGVDPAKMADVVNASAIASRENAPLGSPWFFHCRKPAALAAKRDLGQGVTWFMSDMNQSPEVVLKECARFIAMAPTIRGVLITLKLTDLSQVVDQWKWFETLSALSFQTIRLQQLSAHHKEFALLALK